MSLHHVRNLVFAMKNMFGLQNINISSWRNNMKCKILNDTNYEQPMAIKI